MPWDATSQRARVDIAANYPNLLLKEDYLDMQAFLTSEADVTSTLALFEKIARKNNVYNEQALHQFLIAWEQDVCLVGGCVLVQNLLKPRVFLSYLSRAMTIKDVGAKDLHGWHTHRIQWFLFWLHRKHIKKEYEPAVAAMYVTLGGPTSRTGVFAADDGTDDVLWYDLLDRGGPKDNNTLVQNATCPEYLHSMATPYTYPTLRKCWA
jgi:hypothetical protein